MKKLFPILFVLALIPVFVAATTAQDNKAALINATKFLETKPFDKTAKDLRSAAMQYVIETDDVSVTLCSDVLKGVTEKKNKYGSELMAQYAFGMASFKLSNPEQKDDEAAAQLAGLESMLRAYEAMVTEKSNAKYKGVDELIAKRDKSELAAFVEESGCTKSSN
ncbi:MAG: hypothetical protein DWQ47_13105 [Acidobacteria bacterium]|nr:MAG: hypothetical protein DWQ32_00505 [Acidobacteriota bacterium]REK02981.1 MAG: hypothetical protein DWQ38_11630 [Acidobacteriota bacterium]REK13215.1 MAG: hypothetical protein DWQ43_06195 [Acidobacteriota bacterium]REK41209.1 MAG: hypothetical protein DWQ47_13105 [Acidobacteriota bacterium]